MAMEFWGVEVKAGEPIKVEHSDGIVLHLSQASLGEVKKDKANESAVLYVNVDGKKLVIGTLSADKCPQISYDLVFEKEVELSHSWKHGSVYFCGYRCEMPEESDDEGMFDSESESEEEAEEEEVPVAIPANGKPESKADKSKALADKSKAAKPDKSKVKNAKPDDDSEDDDSDEKDDDSEEDGSDDENMLAGDESEDDDDDEDSSDEEEEATPKNAKQNKKRPAVQPATKTPADKKAKLVTPQKSGGDGKKGNTHTSTPHPSKGGKTNPKADKSKQSPKSGSQVSCKACSKTFNSDGALQSHTKAKHSDSK